MYTLPLKRKDLTLKEKVEVLDYVNRVKCSQSEVARKFGISQAQVSKLLMKRQEVLRDWQENANSTQKRKRSGKESVIDSELLEWYKEKRASNVPVNGPVLMVKAEQIAEANGIQHFRATNGWLHRWKNRSNVQTLRKFLEEPKDVDIATGSNGTTAELPQLVESGGANYIYGTPAEHPQVAQTYDANCIYVCEETVLYYRAAPDSMLCFSGEKAIGDSSQKDSLTVMCCANIDGSHKLEPYVIGTYENPKSFRNVKTLPVKYASSKHACLTVTLFKDWLIEFDKQMSLLKRKALLHVGNNFYVHDLEIRLNNVTIDNLQSNLSLVPPNQGLISLFKRNYRKELIKKFLVSMDCYDSPLAATDEMSKKISLLSAIHMLNVAWTRVTPDCINKCFVKYEFRHASSENASELLPIPECSHIQEDKNSLTNFDNTLPSAESTTIKHEVDERNLNVDDPLYFVNVNSVIKSELGQENVNADSRDSIEDDNDAESLPEAQEVPTSHEVRTACNVLRRFLESKSNVDFMNYYNIENQITQLLCMENKEQLFC